MLTLSCRKIVAPVVAILIPVSVIACREADRSRDFGEPTIEVAPLGRDAGQWKLVAAEQVTVTVTAPGAESVKVLYKPVVAVRRHVEVTQLSAPAGSNGRFSTTFRAGPDFIGEVWAQVHYPDGTNKVTKPLSLAAEAAISEEAGDIPLDSVGGSVKTDESARSDKITGGRVEQAAFVESEPRIWLSINIPAFRLTLWQNGREVKTYQIGIGRKNFPIPVGSRKATEIVWNPEWVPPDSAWVLESEDVEPGERIEADDPRNPLGKIKVRLGQGVLIHEAAKPSDIGHLVSHGCVRMLTNDIFDLTEKIVAARKLPVTGEQIERAKASTERLAVKLNPPLWVDINYDTQVVEGKVLHLYPDVYNRGASGVDSLRAELQTGGVDPSKLDAQTLKQMAGRVSMAEEFLVSVADIQAGRALAAGQNQPLTDYSVEKKPGAKRPRRTPRGAR